jgi:hypothetical protein
MLKKFSYENVGGNLLMNDGEKFASYYRVRNTHNFLANSRSMNFA